MSKSKIMGTILELIRDCETFLICSHVNPDGDAIGSQLTFYSLLSDLGKRVFVVNSDPVPFAYSFLPNAEAFCIENMSDKGVETRTDDRCYWENIDAAIILDCGNLNRVGKKLAERISPKQALVNIDHHISNDGFGTHVLVDPDACATAEIIFNLLEYGNIEISKDRAICLYTAILTDTGCFKYANTTAEAHRIAARLIDIGVTPNEVAESVYEVVPHRKAKLFGMALETLRLSPDGNIAWMSVTQEMHKQTEAEAEDTEGFIDYVRSLRNVKVAILFRETEEGNTRVSLRSKGALSADQVAAVFGGGGHRGAAGCVMEEPLDKAIYRVLEAVSEFQNRN